MPLLDKPIEQPWAFAHRKGFNGEAPGLYFRYYMTQDDAEKARARVIRRGKFAGIVEHRPSESWYAGTI